MPASAALRRAGAALRATLLAVAVPLGAATLVASAFAEENPAETAHGRARQVSLGELTPAQRQQATEAFALIVCACPDENFSKTLAMCPDGCAIPQKMHVIERVKQGRATEEIINEQVSLWNSPKVRADPGAASNGTIAVVVVAGGGLLVSVLLLAWLTRASAARPPRQDPTDAETSAVERELKEIE